MTEDVADVAEEIEVADGEEDQVVSEPSNKIDTPTVGQQTPDGGGSEGGTVKEMAMSTEPSKPLDQIEDPYNPEEGGVTRIYRGIMKAVGVRDLPAIADIAIGIVEWVKSMDLDGNLETPTVGQSGESEETDFEEVIPEGDQP